MFLTSCATLTLLRRNYLHSFCLTILLFFKQASLDGLTGPLHFSEDGARIKIELDILNLRNNSFNKVSHKEHHKIICCCVLWQTFYLMNGVMPCIFSLELCRETIRWEEKRKEIRCAFFNVRHAQVCYESLVRRLPNVLTTF